MHATLVRASSSRARVPHFRGLPPELTGGIDHREPLPWPRFLVIEERAGRLLHEPGVLLYRFDEDGIFGGDSWHATVHDALDQAQYEYGGFLNEWQTTENTFVEFVLDDLVHRPWVSGEGRFE